MLGSLGIDGWLRRANAHPAFDGMEIVFNMDDQSATCTVHRKDRDHPIIVTEYLDECRKSTGPWDSHPKRLLAAMIQKSKKVLHFRGSMLIIF